MTLTKAELADLLFEQLGLNKREAKDMVEHFFEEIRIALERGEAVKLSGFGNFQLREKPQRPGRNPKTGEEIPITARRVVTFHASQKLKPVKRRGNRRYYQHHEVLLIRRIRDLLYGQGFTINGARHRLESEMPVVSTRTLDPTLVATSARPALVTPPVRKGDG